MVTAERAHELARDWIAAWNAHDLDRIMAHYESDVVLISPFAAQLLGSADGKVAGKENVRRYFQKGLEAFPSLRFKLVEVLWGVSSVVLYYENQSGTRTAEHMEISPNGKISRVAANYSGR
jgi:ketosteroid isomerase-like protein